MVKHCSAASSKIFAQMSKGSASSEKLSLSSWRDIYLLYLAN